MNAAGSAPGGFRGVDRTRVPGGPCRTMIPADHGADAI